MSNDQFQTLITRIDNIDEKLKKVNKNISTLNKKVQNQDMTISKICLSIQHITNHLDIPDYDKPLNPNLLNKQMT